MKCEHEGCDQHGARLVRYRVLCPKHAVDLLQLEWELTDYYCRHCGRKNLVREPGEGDYYVGPSFYCRDCKETFTMG